MSQSRLRIVLSVLVSMVNRKGQVTVSDASKLFDLDEERLNDFVKILMDNKILEVEYQASGEKILRKGEAIRSIIAADEIKKRVEEVLDKVDIEHKEGVKEVECLLNAPKKTEEVVQ